MTDRPIIYSARMALAAYEGRKTMTRRPVKKLLGFGNITEFQKSNTPGYDWIFRNKSLLWNDIVDNRLFSNCPYGQPGDRLYARETWRTLEAGDDLKPSELFPGSAIKYEAGGYSFDEKEWHLVPVFEVKNGVPLLLKDRLKFGKIRQSIYLPKWASRTVRKILDVRVERLQDISEEDAIREGFDSREDFIRGWDLIYKENGHGWDENEFVWVVGFERRNR